jgi:hypothetical protein
MIEACRVTGLMVYAVAGLLRTGGRVPPALRVSRWTKSRHLRSHPDND